MRKGFTLVELVIAVGIILTLLSASFIIYSGNLRYNEKSRDIKRLSDLSLLERCINEYKMDNNSLPDTAGILRTSTTLPSGSTDLANSSSGWIKTDLSSYTSRLPIDPLNNSEYYYVYFHNGSSYEINAKLEHLTEDMQKDGGNDDEVYEMGDNLQLISP